MKEISQPILDVIYRINKKYSNGIWTEIELNDLITEDVGEEEFTPIIKPIIDNLVEESRIRYEELMRLSDGKITENNYNNTLNPFNDEQENLLYRVPDISEFIDGFEYEIYSEGFNDGDLEDFCGWYPYKFGEFPNWRELDEIEQELINNNIRVKIK